MKVDFSENARQMLSNDTHMSCPIMDKSALDYFKYNIHGNWEKK